MFFYSKHGLNAYILSLIFHRHGVNEIPTSVEVGFFWKFDLFSSFRVVVSNISIHFYQLC